MYFNINRNFLCGLNKNTTAFSFLLVLIAYKVTWKDQTSKISRKTLKKKWERLALPGIKTYYKMIIYMKRE